MTKRDLTPKQKLFVEAYLSNGMNATEACRQAGYKGNTKTLTVVGCDNLAKPSIKEYIDKEKAKTSKKLNITREDLLKRHLKVLNYVDDIIARNEADAPFLNAYNKTMDSVSKMLGLNEPDKLELSGQIQNKMVVDFGER